MLIGGAGGASVFFTGTAIVTSCLLLWSKLKLGAMVSCLFVDDQLIFHLHLVIALSKLNL